MKQKLAKIKNFLVRHKWSSLLIILALGVAGFMLWDSFSAGNNSFLPEVVINKKPKEEKVRAPLSGRLVEKEIAEKKPIAVVVENHPDARPQSGLNSASLVFETFAEGGITRFLAVFQDEEPVEIGPVRSARPYFVDWALSYDALFAHVGGNSNALNMIKTLRVLDINQFTFAKYFWRDRTRFAPHNVYTTLEKLVEAAKSKNYPTTDNDVPAFTFKEDSAEDGRPVAFSFTVYFNNNFAPTYTYSPKDNSFYRSIRGAKQTDRKTAEQIRAKNVIVCFSDFSYGKSTAGEQMTIIRTTGSGSAYFYIDGQRTSGQWSRTDKKAMIFKDSSGKEVVLNAGTTWIDFVPKGTVVK